MKGRSKGRSGWRQLATVHHVVLALSIFIALFCAAYLIGNLFDAQEEVPPETRGTIKGRFKPTVTMILDGKEYFYFDNFCTNILIVGVDKEDVNNVSTYRNGGQADFLMILSFDRRTQSITPIHIDRDTIADVKVYSPFGHEAGINKMQICLSHAFGNDEEVNCQNTIWAVEQLMMGIPIDHYLVLDMEGIAILNDELGGVTVTLEDDFSHLDPAMTRGTTLTLRGKQAEYFVRSRHDVGDHSNRQRMNRQRVFLNGMGELLEQKLTEDPLFAVNLFEKLDGHVYASIDGNWIHNQSYVIQHYDRRDIVDLKGEHRIGPDGYMEFHLDEKGLKQLIRDIYMIGEEEVGYQ